MTGIYGSVSRFYTIVLPCAPAYRHSNAQPTAHPTTRAQKSVKDQDSAGAGLSAIQSAIYEHILLTDGIHESKQQAPCFLQGACCQCTFLLLFSGGFFHFEPEGAALAHGTFRAVVHAIAIQNAPGDIQPKPGADRCPFMRLFAPVVAVPNIGKLLTGSIPFACVRDGNAHMAVPDRLGDRRGLASSPV